MVHTHSEVLKLQQEPVSPHAALEQETFAFQYGPQCRSVVCAQVQPPPAPAVQQAPSAEHGFASHAWSEKNALGAGHCGWRVFEVHTPVSWSQHAPTTIIAVARHGSGEHEEYSAPCWAAHAYALITWHVAIGPAQHP